jgi:hypothetical protein
LFLLILFVLVRSAWCRDAFIHNWKLHRAILWFDEGFVDFQYDNYGSAESPAHEQQPRWDYESYPGFWYFYFNWKTLGFHYQNVTFPGGIGKHLHIAIPYWPVLFATGILPWKWLKSHLQQRKRRRRQSRGLCTNCGYDLRGHLDVKTGSGCPECATPIVSKNIA